MVRPYRRRKEVSGDSNIRNLVWAVGREYMMYCIERSKCLTEAKECFIEAMTRLRETLSKARKDSIPVILLIYLRAAKNARVALRVMRSLDKWIRVMSSWRRWSTR